MKEILFVLILQIYITHTQAEKKIEKLKNKSKSHLNSEIKEKINEIKEKEHSDSMSKEHHDEFLYADEINRVVKKTEPKKDWKGTGSTPMKIKLPPFKINVPTWPPITLPPYRVNLAPVGPIPVPEIKFEVPTIYPNHNTNIKWPTWPPITSGPIRINLPTWAPYSKDKKTLRITLRKNRKRPIVFGEPLNLPTWAPVKLPPFKVDVPTVYPAT